MAGYVWSTVTSAAWGRCLLSAQRLRDRAHSAAGDRNQARNQNTTCGWSSSAEGLRYFFELGGGPATSLESLEKTSETELMQ